MRYELINSIHWEVIGMETKKFREEKLNVYQPNPATPLLDEPS